MEAFQNLFDLIELPDMGMPVRFAIALPGPPLRALVDFPLAALPQSGRVASGRGLSLAASKASACGEAAELVSCCAWGDENLVSATDTELGHAAILPEALNEWSKAQIQNRARWNQRYADFDWRPGPRGKMKPIDWIRVKDAHGGPDAFVPADFAFIGRKRAGDRAAVAIGDSNGCAAGPTIEEAKLAAVLELIERDATARWWYARTRRAPVDLASVADEGGILVWLAARPRRTWLFDITTDLGIPVFAAASAEPDGRDIALGFAARLEPQAAVIPALTEMLQMEVSLTAARALGEAAPNWAEWRAKVSMATAPLDAAMKTRPEPLHVSRTPVGPSRLSAVLDACARCAIDLYFADMTRPGIGVPVVRVISTAFCHYKPRFGRQRLFASSAGEDISPNRVSLRQTPLMV